MLTLTDKIINKKELSNDWIKPHLDTTIIFNSKNKVLVIKSDRLKWGEINEAIKNSLKLKKFKGQVTIEEHKVSGSVNVKKLSFNGEMFGF